MRLSLNLATYQSSQEQPSIHPTQELIVLRGLTRLGLDLDGRTLSTLLADDAATGGTLGGALGLLSLLDGGGLLLLLLALLDGGETGGGAGLGAHGALLLDHIEGSTDDGTLGLDGAASALLGDLL